MAKINDELHVSEFNVMKNIITDQDIIMWESMGLTADVQSMENAALLSQVVLKHQQLSSCRYSLNDSVHF